jgi:hypothetical protein
VVLDNRVERPKGVSGRKDREKCFIDLIYSRKKRPQLFFKERKAERDAQHRECIGRASSSLAAGIEDRSTLVSKTGVISIVQKIALSYAYAEYETTQTLTVLSLSPPPFSFIMPPHVHRSTLKLVLKVTRNLKHLLQMSLRHLPILPTRLCSTPR